MIEFEEINEPFMIPNNTQELVTFQGNPLDFIEHQSIQQ